jgi:hypothetical protein
MEPLHYTTTAHVVNIWNPSVQYHSEYHVWHSQNSPIDLSFHMAYSTQIRPSVPQSLAHSWANRYSHIQSTINPFHSICMHPRLLILEPNRMVHSKMFIIRIFGDPGIFFPHVCVNNTPGMRMIRNCLMQSISFLSLNRNHKSTSCKCPFNPSDNPHTLGSMPAMILPLS